MLQCFHVRRIIVNPAQVYLGLMHGLGHILLDSADVFLRLMFLEGKGPGADQGLIEKVLFVQVRNAAAVREQALAGAVGLAPLEDLRSPELGHF